MEWAKTSNKRLIHRIYKELLQINMKMKTEKFVSHDGTSQKVIQMANKHTMKRENCKLNVIPVHTYQNMKTEKTDKTNCWGKCRALGTFIHCWWEYKVSLTL